MKLEFGSSKNYLEVKRTAAGQIQIILACPSSQDSAKLVVNVVEISPDDFNKIWNEIQ